MKRPAIVALGIFVLLFLIWRGLFLAYSPYVYDEEEAKTGSISVILMHDKKLPLMEHQPADYEGGTLLFGILAIPFMLIFGKAYLGLKMMALTTSLLLALFSTLWVRKLAGNAGAVASAVLWLCAVPYLVQVSLIPWGNYAETAMLSAVTFYLLHSILFEGKRGPGRSALLGFFFGIGTWMHYGYLITVLTCLLFFWLTDARRLFSKSFLPVAVGGLAGFSPWILYNATHHFWGLVRFSEGLRQPEQTGFFQRFADRFWLLFSKDLPASLQLIAGDLRLTIILSYVYYITLLALVVVYLVFHRKNLWAAMLSINPFRQVKSSRQESAPLAPVAYFFAYALAFCLSEYGLFQPQWQTREPESHVHIFVLLPALLWIGSAAIGRLWTVHRAAALIPLFLLAFLGCAGQWNMLDFERSQVHHLKGTLEGEKKVIYMEIGSKWARSWKELPRLASRLEGIELESYYFGAGITFGLDHSESLNVAIDKCAYLEEDYWPYCQFGIGAGLACTQKFDPPGIDALIATAPETVRPFLVAGVAVGSIWYNHYDHPYLERVTEYDYASLAPESQKSDLPNFIQKHLDMLKTRPPKE